MLRLIGLSLLFGVLGAGLFEDEAGFSVGVLAGLALHLMLQFRDRLQALRDELDQERGARVALQQSLGELRAAVAQQGEALARFAEQGAVASAGEHVSVPAPVPAPSAAPSAQVSMRASAASEAPADAQVAAFEANAVIPEVAAPQSPLPTRATEEAQPGAPVAVPRDPLAPSAASDATASASDRISAGWPAAPDPLDAVREFFLGGNTVVRVGVLVLLIGLALLVKYAADSDLLPLPVRLAGAAAGAMALTAFGFRQREARPGFAHALQGGGIAGLYLVTFFAYRVYELLPAGAAFPLLLATTALGMALAVLQDAMSLAVIAQLGGFAAPIVASTGEGSHVALFSYYLVLNVGIFAVALVRAWRPLNLVGFVATFGIAAAWGALRYEPDHFATTEPFLIAFFLLYVGIPVLYALRHGSSQHAYVDGSLLFGVPLAALLMQRELVGERPFAMAFTTVAMAAVYLGLALVLRRRAQAALETLTDALLALGVGFSTLAVPYGFSNHNLTGATWALEGAGLYFVGVRQSRRLSRAAGAGLQLLAMGALFVAMLDHAAPASLPLLNTRALGALLLAASMLFIARTAHAHRERLPDWEASTLQAFIALGLLFLGGVLHDDVEANLPERFQAPALVGLAGLFGLGLEWIAGRARWMPGRLPTALLLPALPLVLTHFEHDLATHPFANFGYLAFFLYIVAGLYSLHRFAPQAPLLGRAQHPFAFWSLSLLLSAELAWAAGQLALGSGFVAAARLLGPVVGAAALFGLGRTERFPCGPEFVAEQRAAGAGLMALIVVQGLRASLLEGGDASPLPYVVLFNPLDVALLLGFASIARMLLLAPERSLPSAVQGETGGLRAALAAYGFLLFNGLLARAVHQYAHVPFDFDALFDASEMQMTLSIAWASLSLLLMWQSHRKAQRMPWLAAATLLGVVVCKLFLVDLSQLAAVAKIATFLVVGVLVVVMGYVAPVPPRQAAGGEGG